MTNDPLHDYRQREDELRKEEADARRELRELRERIDQAGEDDVQALAQALHARDGFPKATAGRLRDRMRDLQTRILPAYDEALWALAGEVRNALVPDTKSDDAWRLESNTPRWKKLSRQFDPAGVLTEPKGERKPDSVVDWIVRAYENVLAFDAKREAEEEAKKRKQRAYSLLMDAKEADLRSQRERFEREPHGPMAEFNPRPFDVYAFLKAHDLLADYGYTQPGAAIQVQGSREAVQAMSAPPAQDLAPDTSSAATPA